MQTQSIELIEKSLIANREQERANSKNVDGLRKVPFNKIFVREGFNLRLEFDDIEELADSIASEGLRVPLQVDLLKDGVALLTDGERRYRAIELLRKRSDELSKEYEYITVLLNDKDLTDLDRLVSMLTTQSSKHFTPIEEANGFQRLRDGYNGFDGLPVAEIAKRVGKSVTYVNDRLALADATPEEKTLISTGKISPTAFSELSKQEKEPEKRITRITESVSQNKKVRVRDVKLSPAGKEAQGIIDVIKRYMSQNETSGALHNILVDIDAKARKIKAIVK